MAKKLKPIGFEYEPGWAVAAVDESLKQYDSEHNLLRTGVEYTLHPIEPENDSFLQVRRRQEWF